MTVDEDTITDTACVKLSCRAVAWWSRRSSFVHHVIFLAGGALVLYLIALFGDAFGLGHSHWTWHISG